MHGEQVWGRLSLHRHICLESGSHIQSQRCLGNESHMELKFPPFLSLLLSCSDYGCLRGFNSHFRSFCLAHMASKTVADIPSFEGWFAAIMKQAENTMVRKKRRKARAPAVIRVKGTPKTVVIRKSGYISQTQGGCVP